MVLYLLSQHCHWSKLLWNQIWICLGFIQKGWNTVSCFIEPILMKADWGFWGLHPWNYFSITTTSFVFPFNILKLRQSLLILTIMWLPFTIVSGLDHSWHKHSGFERDMGWSLASLFLKNNKYLMLGKVSEENIPILFIQLVSLE